jgi:hypothetical protein
METARVRDRVGFEETKELRDLGERPERGGKACPQARERPVERARISMSGVVGGVAGVVFRVVLVDRGPRP